MNTAIISIDYEEFHPHTYRGVEVYLDDRRPHRKCFSGNPVKDYWNIVSLCTEHGWHCYHSSSVDDFQADSGIEFYAEDTPTPEESS